jgi:hypothetical protein
MKVIMIVRMACATAMLGMAACASIQPIPVSGRPADRIALTGEWSGEYFSVESGRAGAIAFRLVEGDSTAQGVVTMIPRAQINTAAERGAVVTIPIGLTITFVRIDRERVSGLLDPYVDPDAQCDVTTQFIGRFIDANTIRGTYVTRNEARRMLQRGEWSVKRKTAAPGS